MKKKQLIGVAIAAVCGIGAFVGMKKMTVKPQVVQKEVRTNLAEVLVAQTDIGLGEKATSSNLRCRAWPQDAIPPKAVVCHGASTMQQYVGRLARAPIVAGEPIITSKLIKAGEGGVLASILPEGMRAISTKITEDSAVGKLILPNDHVDVFLIRRIRTKSGGDEHTSERLFTNVRVLAIGQRIETKEGQKGVDGNTATLELSPNQSERLALAKSMGDISLALRSIVDFRQGKRSPEDDVRQNQAIRIIKYGAKSRIRGTN